MEENSEDTKNTAENTAENETQNTEETQNLNDTLNDALKDAVDAKVNPQQAAAAAAYAQAAKEAGVTVDEVSDENATVEDETEVLKKELAETESSLKRLRADFENFRRRTNKEKEEVGQVAREEFIRALLPLIDNFERAMATEDKSSESFVEGVNMIYGQFGEILKAQGLEEVQAAGAMFDPNYHQAVGRVQNDTLPEGAVAAVLQTGYQVNGKVIRPAMVQVVGD